jgi:signal transduction histidine kinase
MKSNTLQSKITNLTLRSAVLVVAILSFVVLGYAFIKYSSAKDTFINSIKSTAPQQVNKILPSLLIEEQRGALDLILKKIRADEQLTDFLYIDFKSVESAKTNYAGCLFTDTIESCADASKLYLTIPVRLAEINYGYLIKVKDKSDFKIHDQQLILFEVMILFLIVVFASQFIALSKLASKDVPSALNLLVQWVDQVTTFEGPEKKKPNLEFEEFNSLAERISKLIKDKEEQKVKAKLGELASQVSHDIRSPLSALMMVLDTTKEISEEKRLLVRHATQRINDIANELLKSSELDIESNSSGSDQSIELLTSLVDTLVSEKRVQFRDKHNVNIQMDIKNSYGAFIKVNPSILKRVLSNLINNSIDALNNIDGSIQISIETQNHSVKLVVTDSGCGVPSHILPKLGFMRISYGKKNNDSGSGLGLLHAKESIESFGGKFNITSQMGEGTSVIIEFPLQLVPSWFQEKIILTEGAIIVCIDDDYSIHQIWSQRFSSLRTPFNSISFVSLSSVESFKVWMSQNENYLDRAVFLFDYELSDSHSTGLDLVEQFEIKKRAILVTSRFEEKAIRLRGELLGIKIIPKGMSSLIPIEVQNKKKSYSLCLIDNDPLVRASWSLIAKEKFLEIKTFKSEEQFLQAVQSIDTVTPIFVDLHLDNNSKGHELAATIHQMGFQNISITTGSYDKKMTTPSYINKVIGKEFPL